MAAPVQGWNHPVLCNGFHWDDPRLLDRAWLTHAPSRQGGMGGARGGNGPPHASDAKAVWLADEFSLGGVLMGFARYRERRHKDGPAVVLGHLGPGDGRRKSERVVSLYFCGADFDHDIDGEALRSGVAASGLMAAVYSTHSHLTGDPPVQKWRVITPLRPRFDVADFRDLREAQAKWRAVCCGFAEAVGGFELDQARTDLAGAFYLPSHQPGAPHESYLFGGEFFDWRPYAAKVSAPERRARGQVSYSSRSQQAAPGGPQSITNGGRALSGWARAGYAETFQIADFIADYAHDQVIDLGTHDAIDIICPFAEHHSDPDQPGGCWAVNAGFGDQTPTFIVKCHHNHAETGGAGYTLLDYLAKMVTDDWFGFGDDFEAAQHALESEEYNPTISQGGEVK